MAGMARASDSRVGSDFPHLATTQSSWRLSGTFRDRGCKYLSHFAHTLVDDSSPHLKSHFEMQPNSSTTSLQVASSVLLLS